MTVRVWGFPIVLALFAVSLAAQRDTGVVTGTVRVEGRAAGSVRVAAMVTADSEGAGGGALVSFATTDRDGRYRLEGVPRGRYYIVAGPLATLTYFPGVTIAERATVVAVATGATVPDVNIAISAPPSHLLKASVEIEGRVALSDKFYRPLYGRTTMSLTVQPAGLERILAPVMTDGAAEARIPDAASFRIGVTDLPFGLYIKSIASGSRDLMTNLLELPDPKAPAEIQVVLTTARPESEPAGFTVRGLANGPLDRYPEGLELRVGPALPDSPRRFERIPIPANGVVEIRNVPPGTYRWEMQSSNAERIGSPGLGRFIVKESDVEDLVFPVPYRMLVRGQIQSDVPKPPALTLWITRDGLTSRRLFQEGRIELALQQGHYRFTVPEPPAGYAVTSIAYGTEDLSHAPLLIDGATPQAELRIVLQRIR